MKTLLTIGFHKYKEFFDRPRNSKMFKEHAASCSYVGICRICLASHQLHTVVFSPQTMILHSTNWPPIIPVLSIVQLIAACTRVSPSPTSPTVPGRTRLHPGNSELAASTAQTCNLREDLFTDGLL
jgi:hypothetical protein